MEEHWGRRTKDIKSTKSENNKHNLQKIILSDSTTNYCKLCKRSPFLSLWSVKLKLILPLCWILAEKNNNFKIRLLQ